MEKNPRLFFLLRRIGKFNFFFAASRTNRGVNFARRVVIIIALFGKLATTKHKLGLENVRDSKYRYQLFIGICDCCGDMPQIPFEILVKALMIKGVSEGRKISEKNLINYVTVCTLLGYIGRAKITQKFANVIEESS